jgi:hypothetical protein
VFLSEMKTGKLKKVFAVSLADERPEPMETRFRVAHPLQPGSLSKSDAKASDMDRLTAKPGRR